MIAYAGGNVLVYAGVVSWLILTPVVEDYSSRMPFDAAVWKAENGPGLRVRMVDDLLRRHTLVGKSRREVDALLGVPPRAPYFAEYEYVYWLGPERGLINIDSEWLALRFRNDLVVEAKVVRD